MGYPNFGKVKTITLPIPNDEMTFAEYKSAFGVDLENIPLVDLILLKQTDGECVPVLYIDHENKVMYTANYSVDYSTGFEVKTDSMISKVLAGGTIENAKPIYCHPVHITGTKFEILVLIFDNNSSGYTKTTFWNKLTDLIYNGAFIACDGSYEDNDSLIWTADALWAYQSSSRILIHSDAQKTSIPFETLYNDASTIVVDGVNKIN